MEKTKYKIGEFSKLARVTVRTLRHYEDIGLLKPDIVDMWTGYRYYSPGQLQKLLFIIQLKDLGFTLSEIVDLYDEDSHYPSASAIESKIKDCEKVTKMGQDSDLIKFKELPEVPEAICMKAYGPYSKLREAYLELFAEIANRGYEIADSPRACYVDGIWNQEDPGKWLTIIQVPVRKRASARRPTP